MMKKTRGRKSRWTVPLIVIALTQYQCSLPLHGLSVGVVILYFLYDFFNLIDSKQKIKLE